MIEKIKKELLDITCNKLFNLIGVEYEIIKSILKDIDLELVDGAIKSKVLFKIIPVVKNAGIDIPFNEICEAVVDELKESFKKSEYIGDEYWFNDICIVGNGVLLLKTNNQFYSQILDMFNDLNEFKDKNYDDQTIVVDYSSPNIAKEMHIGHLRSTVLGDSISNLLNHVGVNVVKVNHIGDWGTQFGMILAFIDDAEKDINDLSDIEDVYVLAKEKFDSCAQFKEKSLLFIKKLQDGGTDELEKWNKFRDISLTHCLDIYNKMNIGLDSKHICGESFYVDKVDSVVENLIERKIAVIDDGAVCLYLDKCGKNKDGSKTPFIIKKGDGANLYSTNDLAAIKYRVQEYNPNEIVYVVDNRQKLYFNMLFEAFEKMEPSENIKLTHVGFGTINDIDGKPFKSRNGDVIKLNDVLNMVKSKSYEITSLRKPDLDIESLSKMSDSIAISSIKYYDLMRNRNTDYNFNLNDMFDFDGNTAVYLMYSLARVKGILRKVNESGEVLDSGFKSSLNNEFEFKLVNQVFKFKNIAISAIESKNINLICDYLYTLSKVANSFYSNCDVFCEDYSTMNSRVLLLKAVESRMEACFSILGIEVLEHM